MAFVYRAERKPVAFGAPTTGAEVGPGSYGDDVTRPSTSRVGSATVATPFGSAKERELSVIKTTAAITPGVGAYAVAAADAVVGKSGQSTKTGGASSAFRSGTPKLSLKVAVQHKESLNTHGPGYYNAQAQQWLKGSSLTRDRLPEPTGGVRFVRPTTCPSIPAPHQAFGYEPSPATGALERQPAPYKGYSGVGRDRPGPADYDPKVDLRSSGQVRSSSGARGCTFPKGLGASSILNARDAAAAAPGPGSYAPANVAGLAIGAPGGGKGGTSLDPSTANTGPWFVGAKGTSSFASRAPAAAGLDFSTGTPGPGAYDAHIAALRAASSPVRASTAPASALRSAFASKTARGAATAARNPDLPGPGAYVDPDVGSSLRVGDKYAPPLPGAQRGAFGSTQYRFTSGPGGPGPGDYDSADVGTVADSIRHKAHLASTKRTFGSVSKRFDWDRPPKESHQSKVSIRSPERMYAEALTAAAAMAFATEPPPPRDARPMSSFASTVKRFESPDRAAAAAAAAAAARPHTAAADGGGGGSSSSVVGLSDGPTPWSYNPKYGNDWRPKIHSYKKVAFGTQSGRQAMVPPSRLASPGPGEYQAVDIKRIFQPYVAGSAMAGAPQRFPPGSNFTPGPGAYAPPDLGMRSSLNRKSYNRTVDNSDAPEAVPVAY